MLITQKAKISLLKLLINPQKIFIFIKWFFAKSISNLYIIQRQGFTDIQGEKTISTESINNTKI